MSDQPGGCVIRGHYYALRAICRRCGYSLGKHKAGMPHACPPPDSARATEVTWDTYWTLAGTVFAPEWPSAVRVPDGL